MSCQRRCIVSLYNGTKQPPDNHCNAAAMLDHAVIDLPHARAGIASGGAKGRVVILLGRREPGAAIPLPR